MRTIFRFTIGPVTELGFLCLKHAITQVRKLYDPEIVVCYNCDVEKLSDLSVELIDQKQLKHQGPPPIGVTWKLYPPRLDIDSYEIVIDNDVILNEKIPDVDSFLQGNHALLLEEDSRTYGRFHRHVPAHLRINSGLYGLPPGFEFGKYVKTYAGDKWEENAKGEYAASRSFDEQGLVALILSSQRHKIIPKTVITNCERRWIHGKGCHFIGVNRNETHKPFLDYLQSQELF